MSGPFDWRSVIQPHAAAEAFPMMSEAELAELAEDIKRHGILDPVVLWRENETDKHVLLDGRNRLAAAALLPDAETRIRAALARPIYKGASCDPWAYCCSVNLHRRHLTADQKRDLVTKLLRADPSRSNRSIAGLAKVSDHTVSSVRNNLVDGAQIAHHAKRVGKDGVAQPATKPLAHRQPPAAVVHNTVPRPAPISKMDQARQQREARFTAAPGAVAGRPSLAEEIDAFRVSLKERRPQVELIDRPTRLKLARGLALSLDIDPAEFASGAAP
jgi:hypothetical protein